MNKLNFFMLAAITLSLFSLPVLAADGSTAAKCTKITDTKGNLGLSIGKMSGLCAEFFDNPQQMTFFVILPAALFGIVIWGILEEIHLFSAKPGIHAALAILMAFMLLPTGVFGQVALTIYGGGAMAAVLSVGGVFILGLTFWVRKKINQFGYAGVFAGGFGKFLGYAIIAAGTGFIGYMIGDAFSNAWTGMLIGIPLGVVWAILGSKGAAIKADSTEGEINRLERELRTVEGNIKIKKLKVRDPSLPDETRKQYQSDIVADEQTVAYINSTLAELRTKRNTILTS